MDSAIKGHLGEIVVTHKDRLCRFGFDLFERLFSQYSNGKIVVLHQPEPVSTVSEATPSKKTSKKKSYKTFKGRLFPTPQERRDAVGAAVQ
ncbi:hypothetical protein EBZ80_12615 [bacterium]|nr:hypothetical protein [bacterium]